MDFGHPWNLRVKPAASFSTDAGSVKALSLGRGLGEGGRYNSFLAICSSRISCTVGMLRAGGLAVLH